KKLETEGLITKTVQPQEGMPSRHMYAITEPGKVEFRQWLASDEGEEVSFRYDFFRKDLFFIRCNYIRFLPLEVAEKKIQRQMATVASTIADLQKARATMQSKGVDPVRISILEYGINMQQVRGEWLVNFLKVIEAGRSTK
ncbi:MAG: PadR family transcriptional regulator, partial [Methanomassiliicoccales archaeon]